MAGGRDLLVPGLSCLLPPVEDAQGQEVRPCVPPEGETVESHVVVQSPTSNTA